MGRGEVAGGGGGARECGRGGAGVEGSERRVREKWGRQVGERGRVGERAAAAGRGRQEGKRRIREYGAVRQRVAGNYVGVDIGRQKL